MQLHELPPATSEFLPESAAILHLLQRCPDWMHHFHGHGRGFHPLLTEWIHRLTWHNHPEAVPMQQKILLSSAFLMLSVLPVHSFLLPKTAASAGRFPAFPSDWKPIHYHALQPVTSSHTWKASRKSRLNQPKQTLSCRCPVHT